MYIPTGVLCSHFNCEPKLWRPHERSWPSAVVLARPLTGQAHVRFGSEAAEMIGTVRKGRIDLAAVTGVEDLDLQPEIACRFLHRSQSGLGSRNIARVDHNSLRSHARGGDDRFR